MTTLAGAIEIQMLADLARLKKDMDAAKGMVGDAAREMQRYADTVKAALGGLAGLMTVGAFKQMVQDSIDAVDALDDLSIQTGITVETLSALGDVGRISGVGLDTITGAVLRMGKGLAVANEESKGAAEAIKALGLDFSTFKQLQADQQLLQLAQAMGRFEDGAGKSAVAMTLMGRQGAQLLPYLKDLANTGELVATVTADQVQMANRYNDSMEATRMRVDALKREMALGLLPTLIEVHDLASDLGRSLGDYLAAGAKTAGTQMNGMALAIGGLGTVMEALLVLGANVAFVFRGVGTEIGGIAAQAALLAQGNLAGAAEVRRQMVRDAQDNRAALDELERRVLGATDRALQARRALSGGIGSEDQARELKKMEEAAGRGPLGQLRFTAETKAATDASKAQAAALREQQKALEELAKARQATSRIDAAAMSALDGETQSLIQANAALREEIELIGLDEVSRQALEVARIGSTRALLAERAAMAANAGASAQELQALQQQIELLRQREDLLVLRGDRQRFAKPNVADTLAPRVADDTYTSVRDALAAAFRDTKNPVKAFADALGNAVFTRVSSNLADALATQLVGSSGSGGLFGSLLQGIGALVGLGGGPTGVPMGGTTGDFARFDRLATPLATGIDYVPHDNFRALLHKGERVVPAAENTSAGGGGITYAPVTTIHVDSRSDAAQVQQLIGSAVADGNARQLAELQRMGVL